VKLLSALKKENQGRPPVWLMRQAGRYMPSYQKIKQSHSLKEMFTQADLIKQVTLLPIDELDVDAAIIFSDILLILDVLGFGVEYNYQGRGIHIQHTASDLSLERLKSPLKLKDEMKYLSNSITQLRTNLKVPLIGFSAAPWTLASYAIDGSRAALGTQIKPLLWQKKDKLFAFLDLLTDWIEQLVELQIEAGAQVIQLFDSHSHLLSSQEFDQIVFPYVKRILEKFQSSKIPFIYFTRGTALFTSTLLQLPSCALSIDWQSSLHDIRKVSSRCLQGNFNPWALLSDKQVWLPLLKKQLDEMHNDPSYICNLGHGILPQTPWENVRCFVDYVKDYRFVSIS
jgi:uroporphyrinogen decarboxylase